jgi:hypothetical protein
MLSYHFTTGPVRYPDLDRERRERRPDAALIVAGSSGAVTYMQAVQAFEASTFTEMQKKVGKMAGSFKCLNG